MGRTGNGILDDERAGVVAAEDRDGDFAVRLGAQVPLDCVRRAGRDLFVLVGRVDAVEVGILGDLSEGGGGKGQSGGEREAHVELLDWI